MRPSFSPVLDVVECELKNTRKEDQAFLLHSMGKRLEGKPAVSAFEEDIYTGLLKRAADEDE
jgi:hypothetical protein